DVCCSELLKWRGTPSKRKSKSPVSICGRNNLRNTDSTRNSLPSVKSNSKKLSKGILVNPEFVDLKPRLHKSSEAQPNRLHWMKNTTRKSPMKISYAYWAHRNSNAINTKITMLPE